MPLDIRESTLAVEGPLRVSKWLSCQVLLDPSEMKTLIEELNTPLIVQIDRVVSKGGGVLSPSQFLEGYGQYLTALESGNLPSESLSREYLQAALSLSTDVFYSIPLEGQQRIIKLCRPVIMLQPHRMSYSSIDGKFRSKVFGLEGITWGVQFSYPQLFQNPKTMDVEKIEKNQQFPNTVLYDQLRRWVRSNTLPVSFLVQEKKVNTPIRLGKKCYPWINKHPQLNQNQIKVLAPSKGEGE